MRHLGIDFGVKKIGIALSDEEGLMAFPHTVVKNDARLFEYLKDVIKENRVRRIVIGASLNFKGKENPVMKNIHAFMEKSGSFKIPLVLENEVLTTSAALRSGTKKELIDASAAALILQTYLDKQKAGL